MKTRLPDVPPPFSSGIVSAPPELLSVESQRCVGRFVCFSQLQQCVWKEGGNFTEMDLVVVLLLLCGAPVVRGYGSGLVMDSCEDMRPRHGQNSPQTGSSPFTIITEKSTYSAGEDVKVKLQAPASTPFTGFLLEAREVGSQTPVGSYTVTDGQARLLTCSQRPNSAVSHRSNSAKTNIQVLWRSGTSGDMKNIEFHASFVQTYSTFWVDVKSPVLNFTGRSSQPGISSADCGVSKVCLSKPSNCDPSVSSDCFFMSAMLSSPDGAAVRYELAGPSGGYISFGFSDDQHMGSDDIYICGVGSSGLVELQHAFSTGETAPGLLPLGNVSGVETSMEQGVIRCSFTTINIISTQRTSGFNQTYYLMFAHGPSSNGRIQFHTGTFISSEKVDISRPQAVQQSGQPYIIRAHGALMLTAWMTTASLGMMVARYLKGALTGKNLFGKDVWFVVHVAVMTVTVAATIIAFILAFSHARDWSGGAHPVLGCLVMILSILQPVGALLRCGPQHPKRFLFNWSHALNGAAIKVAAIFTGLERIDSSADQWMMKVMGGFVGWEALCYTLQEAHFRWRVHSTDTSTTVLESNKIDGLLMVLFLLGNLPFLVALLVGIGMSEDD
ncbi:putative ferric-chelate reductase 1 isoform X2 [Parambassis ranga]|uniref:Ferric-chelate reductase 1 isoform X2 n=1 Tax=Parambassis ranga TaxID=210632 RepID=A0A6P7KKY1_9TELE|nr:putative ferric-chelate reductase 1 isoform X2 [Parambassis ranga]